MTDAPTEREGEGGWANLRRRKFVQWGLAYAAGAWALLQVIGFLADAFHWPDATKQIAAIAFAIGFPIALALAWYHGDRGQQRVSGAELAILSVLLALGGGALLLYGQRDQQTPAPPARPAAPTAAHGSSAASADERPSIAVLPFENRSRLEDDVFFVDGVHDDILTQLSKVSALKVISRTSVEKFRDTQLSTKEIAGQLGVRSILEGGVQRAGDRVRINVQLIDTATDAHLWAETYDRDLTAANIFSVQSEVAAAIAGALNATLTREEKGRIDTVPTRNLEAWETYQLGRQRMARRTSESLTEAEQFFRKAIELDPGFALAYVGLADTLALQTDYSGRPWESTLAEAEEAVLKALALDPSLAEAWTSRGGIAMGRGDYRQAEELFRKAIELNPNYATAHHWLGAALTRSGRPKNGLEHLERAVELDPLSAIINVHLAESLQSNGRFDEAAVRYSRAIQIDSGYALAYANLAIFHAFARNRYVDAVALQERVFALDPGNPMARAWFALMWFDLNDDTQAKELIGTALRLGADNLWVNIPAAYMAESLGDRAAAEGYARNVLAQNTRDASSLEILALADFRRGTPENARARYASAFPELLDPASPRVDPSNVGAAIWLAAIMQKTGEAEQAATLLDASERTMVGMPRLGTGGFGIGDVSVHALRGDKAKALAKLREAEKAGWRVLWRYARDVDSTLASIRDEPGFKAVFADIERDMARQRAALAARPTNAPLDVATTH